MTCTIADATIGNTGLGREAIQQLAKHDPSHIFLAARTPSKGEAAVAEIKKAVPSASISFLHLDLASFSSISSAAKAFTSQSKRLDILMNNAGIMATPAGTTEDGYEIQVGLSNVQGLSLLTPTNSLVQILWAMRSVFMHTYFLIPNSKYSKVVSISDRLLISARLSPPLGYTFLYSTQESHLLTLDPFIAAD